MGTNYYARRVGKTTRNDALANRSLLERLDAQGWASLSLSQDDGRALRAMLPDPPIEALDELHIGKPSAGWAFALHVEPDSEWHPKSLDEWTALLTTGDWEIIDEYGRPVTTDAWLRMVRRPGRRSHSDLPGDGPCRLVAGEFC